MRDIDEQIQKKGFAPPSPDVVLDIAEENLGVPFTNLFRPLNSYINRVYELLDDNGEQHIIKFYRPGRWSEKAIAEEHRFLCALKERDLPVVAPSMLNSGETLGKSGEYIFAVFPKFGGRSIDEFNDEQWLELGRMIARVHLVAKLSAPAIDRRCILERVPEHSSSSFSIPD